VAYFKILSRHLSGVTEGNHRNPVRYFQKFEPDGAVNSWKVYVNKYIYFFDCTLPTDLEEKGKVVVQ
jgi:hypothetical protein